MAGVHDAEQKQNRKRKATSDSAEDRAHASTASLVETEPLRIVLLGKTGSGKSSLGNTVIGENMFDVCHLPNSKTKTCTAETRQVKGKKITLIDTPGVFDTDPESIKLNQEILKCIEESAAGVHAFLLVLRVERYTQQEKAVVDATLKYFSEEALKFTTVVFTRGEDLPDETKIEDWVSENDALKKLIQKCGGRCHVFDNKHWKESQHEYRNNQVQIESLLNTIEKTVRENGDKCYTNEMLQKVATDKSFLVKLTGVSTGVLLGALLGVPMMIVFVLHNTKDLGRLVRDVMGVGAVVSVGAAGGAAGGSVSVGASVGAGAIVAGAVVGGAVYGGLKGFKAAEQAETPGEAFKAVLQDIHAFLTEIKNTILPQSATKYQKVDSLQDELTE